MKRKKKFSISSRKAKKNLINAINKKLRFMAPHKVDDVAMIVLSNSAYTRAFR